MPELNPAPRFTLRALALPPKLVVTCFLMAVGLGYSSAMIQLHMQDSRSGKPMPTVDDVVAKFTGKRWLDEAPPRPVSQLEKLIMGPADGAPFNGNGSMAPVFFHKDAGNFNKLMRGASPEVKAKIIAEREGERLALQIWINLPTEKRQDVYDSDRLLIKQVKDLPAERTPRSITPKYAHDPSKIAEGIKVKTILLDRCVRCHKEKDSDDSKAAQYPLEMLAHLEGYMEVPAGVTVPANGGWVKVEEPISLEKLTQSTHAHMLSFAVLFSLTGLVFAFSSYPALIRGILGPLALVAVTVDVGLWWLARQCDQWGPYFAQAVIGSGATVGVALTGQIVLSIFNMYGKVGKLVLAAIFAGTVAGGALIFVNQIQPGLDKKAAAIQAAQQPKPEPDVKEPPKKKEPEKKEPEKKEPEKKEPILPGTSRLEELLAGEWKKDGPWPMKGGAIPPGAMVRAFFDKETEFRDTLKDGDAEAIKTLTAEREGERSIVLAWVKSSADARKKAFDDDKFPMPPDLKDKPFTAGFFADAKAVKIRTLLDTRCSTCHSGENATVPLDKYEQFEVYFKPAAKK